MKLFIIALVVLGAGVLWFYGRKSGSRMRIVEKFKPWYPET